MSLTRTQYEQLLDTWQWLTASPVPSDNQDVPRNTMKQISTLSDITEEDTGVTTLNMDPHVRAKLFPAVIVPNKNRNIAKNKIALKGTKNVAKLQSFINLLCFSCV